MDKAAARARELRIRTVRDAKTGKILEKPVAPSMRTVEKGAWTYRELPPSAAKEPDEDGGRR
ncbi:MAG TPA: hypothetical protein VK943_12225 [Arenibaculum sp.]|nr:hypothetical protein [Arenibaculum sp.]